MTKECAEAGILNTYRCKILKGHTLAATVTEAKKSFGCVSCSEATRSKDKCYGPKALELEVEDPNIPPPTQAAQIAKPEAIKHDASKARFDLVPPKPLMELVQVYTTGAEKYGDRNWEKGMSWGRVFAATMRHLWSWRSGEDKDSEDGLSHIAHAAWNMFALMEYARTHPELDDR